MIVWEPNWEPIVWGRPMAERRGRSEDSVYCDHMGTVCRDARYHRSCSGRWRGEVNLGKDGAGKRIRRKVSAMTKTEAYAKLAEPREEVSPGHPLLGVVSEDLQPRRQV